ncbi:hypothetical protein DID80_04000 [Candidatus Marinamargulisbacteria bacterium SCGC AAA071-K20]|nr:hypothetical protein DID80_04000 [Candidatus Marinamargulisbacteria bacterium SCGC AAA071-K20]
MTEDNLKKAIENLSQKKHVINEGALKAKETLENGEGTVNHTSHHMHKQSLMMDEFNKSIRLLMSVFKESNFDDMALMVTNPWRVFILNFCIGILRGLGFMIGLVVIVYFLTILGLDLSQFLPLQISVK